MAADEKCHFWLLYICTVALLTEYCRRVCDGVCSAWTRCCCGLHRFLQVRWLPGAAWYPGSVVVVVVVVVAADYDMYVDLTADCDAVVLLVDAAVQLIYRVSEVISAVPILVYRSSLTISPSPSSSVVLPSSRNADSFNSASTCQQQQPELTMGQRVTGHRSSGSTNLSGSRGSLVSTRDR